MPLPPAPSKRAALLSPDALDAPARPSHRGSRRAGDSRDDASAKSGPQPLELFDNLGTEGGGDAVARPARRAKAKVAPASAPATAPARAPVNAPVSAPISAPVSALVSAPQQPAAVQVETRVPTPSPAPVAAPQPPARAKRSKSAGPAKLFVLDTNVLLHDPMCLFRFEEHDIFLPMIVLEELDGHKKGTTEVARNGRQTSRTLDALAGAQDADIDKGLKLDTTGHREAGGRLFFQTAPLDYSLPVSLPQGKADNQILGVVQALRDEYATDKPGKPKQEVVLVSKDINMRVKARALGLAADDYQNDKTLEDGDLLYAGSLALPPDFWTRQSKTVESWQSGSTTFYRISGPLVPNLYINQFVFFEAPGEPSMYARVTEIRDKTAVLKTLKDYSSGKNAVWGVNTRNREQNFAMNLLMDPEIDFVTLTGTAGTGKTLMALASGLTQVLDDRRYTEIIMTRATVSVGEDIGFLPGTEEEKMGPWMGALDDNLEFLAKGDGGGAGEWGRAATNELIRSRIKVKSMNFMRGRTFLNKYVIIDEAQNLTPKQMKTLITRAGPGTKIICMGNLAQIDTPYLTEGSSGLTFAVDKFKGWPHGGHITLARGERSRLADFASDVL
ncbi:PhoH family protein [Variovorax sp. J22G73]|uniref:PhoH family protein n=1 Tax=unclassified Variovorax TaxID=663243 RepID=UPI000D5E8A5A|nr:MULTISPECIES: PhoH family protein [unclassified Variovorax]MDM0003689.1 PhoH family protein [Variovorax sp. J22R203]MDM0096645.1 PhoH family protein [Variovorax sp. J22G73]